MITFFPSCAYLAYKDIKMTLFGRQNPMCRCFKSCGEFYHITLLVKTCRIIRLIFLEVTKILADKVFT